MSNIQEFLSEINIVIYEIEKEILEHKKDSSKEGYIQQLEFIKSELEQIREQALANALPPKDKRYTAFSRYVVDEWDANSVLGTKLCKLADKYKRKL